MLSWMSPLWLAKQQMPNCWCIKPQNLQRYHDNQPRKLRQNMQPKEMTCPGTTCIMFIGTSPQPGTSTRSNIKCNTLCSLCAFAYIQMVFRLAPQRLLSSVNQSVWTGTARSANISEPLASMITLQGTITAKELDSKERWVPTLFPHYVSRTDKAPQTHS